MKRSDFVSGEKWYDIPGFSDYQVSDLGSVWRKTTTKPGAVGPRVVKRGYYLAKGLDSRGKERVVVRGDDGGKKTIRVLKLMELAGVETKYYEGFFRIVTLFDF